jgi:glycerate-2-kinase
MAQSSATVQAEVFEEEATMRIPVLAALMFALAAWAPHAQAAGVDPTRVRDLLAGIAQDVAAIYESFAGGLDDPHSPVSDPVALRQAASHLDAATARAHLLVDELGKAQP